MDTSIWPGTWTHATPHGVLSGVRGLRTRLAPPEAALRDLLPAERGYVSTLRGYQQREFVAGRSALRYACRAVGAEPPALLPGPSGAPLLPAGIAGSIAHKRDWAVGLAARSSGETLGVDLEVVDRPRLSIARLVLTDRESTAVAELPVPLRWPAVLLRFSIKEALYKALDGWGGPEVTFQDVEVHLGAQGLAEVFARTTPSLRGLTTSVWFDWAHEWLVTSVRVGATGAR